MNEALHCYVPCINTHSFVPVCLGQGQAFWPKCCPVTTNTSPSDAEMRCTHRQKAAYDSKYIVMLIRRRGSGAVAVCFISFKGIPRFPHSGRQPSGACTYPASSLSVPGFSAVLPRHLPVSCGIPWYAAQASLFPSSDRVRRRWAAIQRCFSALSLSSNCCSITRYPEPGGAVSCRALIHWELTLPVQRRRELFEGCGLPGILSAQVLSVLPQPSQRQYKSRKAYFALWLPHQKYPRLLPGKLLVEGGAAVAEGRGSTSLFGGCTGSTLFCSRCSTGSGRNYF